MSYAYWGLAVEAPAGNATPLAASVACRAALNGGVSVGAALTAEAKSTVMAQGGLVRTLSLNAHATALAALRGVLALGPLALASRASILTWLSGLLRAAFPLTANPLLIATAQRRALVATAIPRRLTVTAASTGMALTRDLTPPIDASVETLTVTFDFGPMLASSIAITSVVSIACSVHSGSDPTPSSRLIGGPQLASSPSTGLADQAVLQQIGTMVGGVTYTLQCVIATSDGNKPSLWTHLACVTPQ